MARFDRAIPPGGEGKITLKANLKGYKGNVRKTATVYCDDPRASPIKLALQGNVRALIEIRPAETVSFRGMADKVEERAIELVGGSKPFHITKVETNLENKIAYRMETGEDGKQYRLMLSNIVKQGSYNGFIKLHTDLAQKSELNIRVSGSIEGEIAVSPKTLLIGKLGALQPARTGKILVASNSGKPFKITQLAHDENLIQVAQIPLPNQNGFTLEITPKLETIPPGARQQTTLTIETDVPTEAKQEVQIQLFNSQ